MGKKISKRKKAWIERTVDNNREYKNFLYNRFYIYALLALLQFAGWGVFWNLLVYRSDVAFATQIVVAVLMFSCTLYILTKHESASSRVGWLLLVLLAPVFGSLLYITCGEGRPTKAMRRRSEKAQKQNLEAEKEFFGERDILEPQNRADGVSRFLMQSANYPVYNDGDVVYYDSGSKAFEDMKAELEKAERFILLEYFIIAHGKMWGDILKILLQKAEEGVQVRIIYDDFGCMTTLPPKYDRYLESLSSNIRCLSFNNVLPIFSMRMNNRDHRKILVIDGKVAFTGGFNLADEYIDEKRRFGYWKDSGVKITGGAVNSFTRMFFDMWNAFYKGKEDLKKYLVLPFNADIPA